MKRWVTMNGDWMNGLKNLVISGKAGVSTPSIPDEQKSTKEYQSLESKTIHHQHEKLDKVQNMIGELLIAKNAYHCSGTVMSC